MEEDKVSDRFKIEVNILEMKKIMKKKKRKKVWEIVEVASISLCLGLLARQQRWLQMPRPSTASRNICR